MQVEISCNGNVIFDLNGYLACCVVCNLYLVMSGISWYGNTVIICLWGCIYQCIVLADWVSIMVAVFNS